MSHSKHLIALALTLACTSSEPVREKPKPVVESEVEPAPTVVDPGPTPPRATPEAAPPDPVPGFVIYTEDRSILVPSDGSAPVIGEGLWVQDDRSESAPITHTLVFTPARAEAMKLPGRAYYGLDGACTYGSFESRSFDPETGSIIAAPDSICTSLHQVEGLGWPAMEFEGKQLEPCASLEEESIGSLVGGRLYVHGWDWNGACFHGESVYDAYARAHDLVRDPPELDDIGMRSLGCDFEFGMPEIVQPWPFDGRGLTECDDDYIESELFLLRRGDLWEIGDNISGAGGWRAYSKRRARAIGCPSINDPCGDPEPYRARAKLDRRGREFWIATDGSAALSAEHSTYALWQAGSAAPIEFELAEVDASTDVIGVRIHADLRRLRALIAQHPGLGFDRAERAPATVPADTEECKSDKTAHAWGEECVEWMEIDQWTNAEAACLCGFAVADTSASRGALLYNLGVIAEIQGAREQAVLQYGESLRHRPGNVAVQQRLAKLVLGVEGR